MLKVHAKKLHAVEVLSLEGQIVNGETEILRSAVELASRDFVLDFSNVRTVDAHGLGVLLQLREQTLARGIHMELINVSKAVGRVFEITRLDSVFGLNPAVPFIPEIRYSRPALVAA